MGGKKVLYWAPRILCILFILFMGLFSLDAFSGEGDVVNKIVGFLIHLIPSFVLIGLTVVAWKWEKVGGISFLIIGGIFTLFYDTYEGFLTFFLISGPVFLIGILFLLSSNFKKK